MVQLTKVGWGFKPDQIEDSVKEALEEFRIPLSKDNDSDYITFENVEFKRDSASDSSAAIKEAVTFEKSILTRIYADVVEYEKGRRTVRSRNLQIGQLPQLLEGRNTFMVTGSEYNLVNQPRRKSSVFVYSNSGAIGSAIADFNLAKGRNFDLSVDPSSGLVMMHIGGSEIAIRPLLESVGMDRQDLVSVTSESFAREHWDPLDVQQALLNNYRKLYGRIYEYRQEDVRSIPLADLKKGASDYFKQTSVDPKTTEYLFDQQHKRIDAAFMKDILRKFYAVNTGEDEGIDPDDLYYQKLYPPNMLFSDRIKKVGNEIANNVRHKLKLGHDYDKVFRNIFSKYLVGMVNSSDLSRLDPQYNPIGMYAASTRMSPIGMGGISDVQAVTRSKRGVHSSYFGVVDPTATAQGINVGIQLNLTDDVKIDKEGEIYLPLTDRRGNTSDVRLSDTYNKKIALPEGKADKERYAMYKGGIVKMGKGDRYDYRLPRDTASMFSSVNQLVPFPQATQGNRSFMTARQITQALPLKYGESPYVEPVTPDGVSTFRKLRKDLESLIPMESPYSGEVIKVGDGKIVIRDGKNERRTFQYHEHLPFATNTGLHQVPVVKVGDMVKSGQMLVKDGYTTDDGKLALGKNLKLGFMPYYGDNTEDGIVISESASEKLTSMHYHTFNTPVNDTYILDKSRFRQMFGSKYEGLIDFDKYDDRGVLKKGEEVQYHDPVMLIIERKTPDDRMGQIGKISKKVIIDLVDGSQLYEGMATGKAVDVSSKPGFISITLVSEEKAVVGDKLTGLYGNKGTVSKIVPDDMMIKDEKGEPLDALYSSTTVVSRINPGQVYENALGKIVASGKRGAYHVPVAKNPTEDDLGTFTAKELKKYGIKDKERVFDPVSGKHVKRPIAVGRMYMLKLLKGDKDVSARGVGPGYTSAGTPSKGGKQGAKSIGIAEFNALVAHNARAYLTDAGNIKSQKNDEYWKGLEMGIPVPTRQVSQTWEKTKSLLTAAGGYVTQDNSSINLMPITDKVTNTLAGHRTIKTPAMLNSKNLEPMKKGLFDPETTGGLSGKLWSKLELEDGIISPLVVDHLRLVMGKSEEDMKKWQSESTSKQMINELNGIDVNGRLKELIDKSKTRDLTNAEIKQLRFLKNMKDRGGNLREFVITKIPVPPPIHRPVTKLEDGGIQISDVNLFYKDVMLANEALKGVKGSSFAPEAKRVLLDNVNALIGVDETHNMQLKKKGARGILPYFSGVGSPKNGYIHSTLMKKNQDLSGRSRIIADSNLSMDEVGVPEKMAWNLFEPHIMKQLKDLGIPPLEASRLIKERRPQARKALGMVADRINILYNRNPTLHRHGILAAKPVIISDSSIHLNLPATRPLNADFDGDAIQLHIPSNDRVSRSLDSLMLSKNVFSDVTPGDLAISFHTEAVLGLYQKSVDDPAGFKKALEGVLGKGYNIAVPMDKKAANALLVEIARKDRDRIAELYDKIRHLGERFATEIGSTVGVEDVMPMTAERDRLINKYRRSVESAKDPKARASLLQEAQNEARNIARTHKGDLSLLVKSGAKGGDMQLANILVSPVMTYDPDKPLQTVELTPGSYAEGLNMRDFWLQNIKVKKDAIATALNVAVPGSIGKLMVYNTLKEVISMKDCGTQAGVELDWNSPDITGRVIQESVPGFKRGDIITSDNRSKLPKRKILVRSPKTCAAHEGICQLCYGTDSYWKFLDIGTNVGVRASQAIIEPVAQKALDSKHGGRDLSRDVRGGGLQALTEMFSSDSSKSTVATLSEQDDVVEDVQIRKGTTHLILMESGKKYRVHPESEIIVKKGDKVDIGQKLTEGIIPYTDMTRLKGIRAGRQALVNEFKNLKGTEGINERLFDTVAKGAVNYVEVQSAFDSYLPGDTIPYNKLVKLGIEKGLSVPSGDLRPGVSLAEEVLDYSAGHRLTESDITRIKASGKLRVSVFPETVRVLPSVKSFYTSGMLEDSWVDNIAQKYIKKTLTGAAAEGKSSKTVSLSPIVPWLTGRPFRETGPEY